MTAEFRLGALRTRAGRCRFEVWAPNAARVELHLVQPRDRLVAMEAVPHGYWKAELEKIEPGTLYFYRLNGGAERPDPASRFQPEGVHGPSEVVDSDFGWDDAGWTGLPLRDFIFYEVHVGAFSEKGTFAGIEDALPRLRDLGITALEIMPVAQFPGSRNWGYDGVGLFAVQNSYGGPAGLKRLVNACHRLGIAAVLDVVYNHLGPEGNYLREFGPYFNDSDQTLWGASLNFDGPRSDQVRRFFLENALYWQREFHFDALRLDAVHAIRDFSAFPFLRQLARQAHGEAERLRRPCWLIAESDLNDARLIRPEALGGYGLDAQWTDDFHHCLHVLLTGERQGYYQDYGGAAQLAKVFRHGYAFTGQYSSTRRRSHGAPPDQTSAKQFVVFAQNHDQIGNRLLGDRLTQLASFEGLKLAAGTVLLSPFLPLLFMGEEYGEPAPFQYMTSHSDPQLVEAVRAGRRREFEELHGTGPAPDPQDEATFLKSRLHPELPSKERPRRVLLEFYQELIRLRKSIPALIEADKERLEILAMETTPVLRLHFWSEQDEVLLWLCFADAQVEVRMPDSKGAWRKLLDSAAPRWEGCGSTVPPLITDSIAIQLNPKSLVLFHRSHLD